MRVVNEAIVNGVGSPIALCRRSTGSWFVIRKRSARSGAGDLQNPENRDAARGRACALAGKVVEVSDGGEHLARLQQSPTLSQRFRHGGASWPDTWLILDPAVPVREAPLAIN